MHRVLIAVGLAVCLLVFPAAILADAQTVQITIGEDASLDVGDRLEVSIFAVGTPGPGVATTMDFFVPSGLEYVSGPCREEVSCVLAPDDILEEPRAPVVFDVVGPTERAMMALRNTTDLTAVSSTITIDGVHPTTTRFSAQECTVLQKLTGLPGLDSRADVLRASAVALSPALISSHEPVPPPASDGPCEVPVDWTADSYPSLESIAERNDWSTDEAAHAAGSLIVTILIALVAS